MHLPLHLVILSTITQRHLTLGREEILSSGSLPVRISIHWPLTFGATILCIKKEIWYSIRVVADLEMCVHVISFP